MTRGLHTLVRSRKKRGVSPERGAGDHAQAHHCGERMFHRQALFEHALLVSDIMVGLNLTAQNGGCPPSCARGSFPFLECPSFKQVEGQGECSFVLGMSLTACFAIESKVHPNIPCFLFLEADRGTMPMSARTSSHNLLLIASSWPYERHGPRVASRAVLASSCPGAHRDTSAGRRRVALGGVSTIAQRTRPVSLHRPSHLQKHGNI